MKLTEGAVGFHLGNDGVDKDEEIVLPLAHQHTDFSVGERVLDKRWVKGFSISGAARRGSFCTYHGASVISVIITSALPSAT